MVKAVIFDMFETLISYHTSPVYFGTQMAMDAGVPVQEFLTKWRATDYDRTAQMLGMKAVQATWYLKEGTSQPVGRKPEFEEAKGPMDVVRMVNLK